VAVGGVVVLLIEAVISEELPGESESTQCAVNQGLHKLGALLYGRHLACGGRDCLFCGGLLHIALFGRCDRARLLSLPRHCEGIVREDEWREK
jgi:hypothetical protein